MTGGAGLRGGEILDLYGPSGGGKSWVLWQFVKYTLERSSSNSVVYFDLDGRVEKAKDKSFHLFQPRTSAQALATLQGLDEWLYRHPDEHVTLVILDGAAPAAVVHDLLKSCQAKWGFVLMTATPSFEDQQRRWYDYRFHVYKENNTVKMRLVWPPTTTPSDVISCEFQ